MEKINCWEFKNCYREKGNPIAEELGICPASTELSLDGIHGGKNAGRACWAVAGTMCEGVVQGTFALKYENCGLCDFYEKVKDEEGENLIPTVLILKKYK
jgi:hypothetical protein